MTQHFYIFTNTLNYSDCSNDLFPHMILITLSIGIVSDSNKLSNGPKFYSKSIEYPQTPLYDRVLKLLLGLNFKLLITRCTHVIMTFFNGC